MPDGIEPMVQIFAQLGVAAVLAWHLFYVTTVSFPKAQEQMLQRMDALSDRHAASVERVVQAFAETLKQERVDCHARLLIMQDEVRHLRGLSDSMRKKDGGSNA